MKSIATLTMNPTIDISYEVDRVVPTQKLRSSAENYAAGGGGINVARVFTRLGGRAHCLYLSGGATGVAFDGLVDRLGLAHTRIAIAGDTRVATTVHERASGCEYRFTASGPDVSEAEWRQCLDMLAGVECDYLVASGSLPRGVPADFYARVADIARGSGIAVVLDTSGEALRQGLAAGGVLLVKPSLDEMRELTGLPLESLDEIKEAAAGVVAAGQAEMVAVTLGPRGGVLATREGTQCLRAVAIEAKSAVGAGDSFIAGMVHALASGWSAGEAFRYGMAAGSAAVLTPGTTLALQKDIARLFSLVPPC